MSIRFGRFVRQFTWEMICQRFRDVLVSFFFVSLNSSYVFFVAKNHFSSDEKRRIWIDFFTSLQLSPSGIDWMRIVHRWLAFMRRWFRKRCFLLSVKVNFWSVIWIDRARASTHTHNAIFLCQLFYANFMTFSLLDLFVCTLCVFRKFSIECFGNVVLKTTECLRWGPTHPSWDIDTG